MKKLIFKLFILSIICALALAMLISCALSDPVDTDTSTESGEVDNTQSNDFLKMSSEDQALYILSGKSPTVPKISSITMVNNAYFSGAINGTDFNMTAYGTTMFRHMNSTKELIYNDYLTSVYTINGYSIPYYSQTTFDNGKMGVLVSNGEKSHAFWSYITQDEFIEFAMPLNNYDVSKESCKNISCVKSHKDGYIATFSGFTPKGLKQFDEIARSFNRFIDIELKDARITLVVDNTLSPIEISIDLIFNQGNESRAPIMHISSSYQKINSTTDVSVDITNFKEIKDLRHLYDNLDAISYAQNFEALKLDYTSKLILTDGKKEVFNEKESSIITFSDNALGYTYSISTAKDNEIFKFTYNDGTLTTINPTGRITKNPMTTPNARLNIDSYIDIASLSALTMKNVAFDGKKYYIELDSSDTSSYQDLVKQVGKRVIDIASTEARLTTEINDGELGNYLYTLTITFNDGYVMTLTINCFLYYGQIN